MDTRKDLRTPNKQRLPVLAKGGSCSDFKAWAQPGRSPCLLQCQVNRCPFHLQGAWRCGQGWAWPELTGPLDPSAVFGSMYGCSQWVEVERGRGKAASGKQGALVNGPILLPMAGPGSSATHGSCGPCPFLFCPLCIVCFIWMERAWGTGVLTA